MHVQMQVFQNDSNINASVLRNNIININVFKLRMQMPWNEFPKGMFEICL